MRLHIGCREDVKELDITYDWTYTTDYKGSLQRLTKSKSLPSTLTSSEDEVKIEATADRIDYEKLKEREPILWFEDVSLYEDELHDHGVSAMSVKVVSLQAIWLCLQHLPLLDLTLFMLSLAARNGFGVLRVVTLLDAAGPRHRTSARDEDPPSLW